MIDLLIKESKELLRDRENESTWFKIFVLFEKLNNAFETRAQIVEFFPQFTDLVLRSIQSDRSRLNGVALEFLRRCVEIAKGDLNFNSFVGPVLRLTGKSNKVFISRAMDTLEALCKHADPRCLLKNINDSIESANKNVRLAVYKVVSLRVQDSHELFQPFVERGLKDPAQEVRNVCKSISGAKCASPSNEIEIKKNAITSLTPRKAFKVDKSHEEIKKIGDEVTKTVKDHLVRKPIQQDFFEKLNQLKKERHIPLERKEDELTPRRLDRYLNKFRSKSPDGLNFTNIEPKQSSNPPCSLSNAMQPERAGSAAEFLLETVSEKSVSNCFINAAKAPENPEEAQISFVHETMLFKKEMDSSGHKDASVVHELLDVGIARQEINSDSIVHLAEAQDILEDYEESFLIQDSLLVCESNAFSCIENEIVSDLSRSFAGIAIEPSRQGDFAMNEEALSTHPDAVASSGIQAHTISIRETAECEISPSADCKGSYDPVKSVDGPENCGDKIEVTYPGSSRREFIEVSCNRMADDSKALACDAADPVNGFYQPNTSHHSNEPNPSFDKAPNLTSTEAQHDGCTEKQLSASANVCLENTRDIAPSNGLGEDPSVVIGLYEDEDCQPQLGLASNSSIANEHSTENTRSDYGPEAILDHEDFTQSRSENVSNLKPKGDSTVVLDGVRGAEAQISIDDDLGRMIDTDLDILQSENFDTFGNLMLNDLISNSKSLKKLSNAGDQDTFLLPEDKGAGNNQTIILNTVEDQGVQNVFCPEMSSKLSTHKLFSENIFESDEEEAISKSFSMTGKPVFSIPIRIVPDNVHISNRLSLDSRQDTLFDNALQDGQEPNHSY